MLGNILLGAILGYIVWKLCNATKCIKPRIVVRLRPNNNIEGLLLPAEIGVMKEMPEAVFTAFVKARFAQISSSFAANHLKCVQNFVTPNVLNALQEVVDQRLKDQLTMEYKLVDFKKVKVQDITKKDVRWVEFETEQVNLLKDKSGKVVEGNELYLSNVKEKWQFTWSERQGWLLSATEMVDTHAI